MPQFATSVFIIPPEYVKNSDVVLNRVAREVVNDLSGVDPVYVFTYEGRPILRMPTSGCVRGRSRAGLPWVRVHDLKHTFSRRSGHITPPTTRRPSLEGSSRRWRRCAPAMEQPELLVMRTARSEGSAKLRQKVMVSGERAA